MEELSRWSVRLESIHLLCSAIYGQSTSSMSSDNKHSTPLEKTGASIIDRLKQFGRGRSHERASDGQSTLVHGRRSRSSSAMSVPRSTSRSRADGPIVSTGRGGAGNLIPKGSESHEPIDEPRGREPVSTSERVTHSGRGGAGNIRSPSRDPEVRKREAQESAAEAAVVHEHAAHDTGVHSTGRGGWGNISRSRSPAPNHEHVPLVSSGRGGAGNVHPVGALPDGHEIAEEDAQVLAEHKAHEEGVVHSTGRGGDGNILPGTPVVPPSEHLSQQHATSELEAHAHSTGRGGAGNIVDPSVSEEKEEKERGRSEHHTHGGLLGKIGEFVKHGSKSRERSVDKA